MKRLLLAMLATVVLNAAVLIFFTSSGFAQAVITVAQLNGTVRDASGAVMVNANISMRNLDTNRTYTATTNTSGFYVVPNLPPGPYELTVTYTGFEPHVQSGVQLTVGQTATLDVTLAVQGRRETVEVSLEAPAIEPTRTEISNVIETKQITSLPISGRLFTDFALLTPGVSTGRTSLGSTITEFEVTRVSFAGMRDLSNAVIVDGADNINTATGSQRATPPQEAVQEFRVVNNSFGAEYGRALGGIVNIITKSGTNTFHGSVYDYFQNNKLNARTLLQPEPQPNVLRQNQFGFTIGGPIRKDRTFIFGNYEGQRRGESPTYPSVFLSNLALINASKTALGIAPENPNVLKTKDNDYGIVRFDHQLSTRNQLSLRYNIEDARDLNQLVGATLDGGGIGAPSSGHNVFLSDQSLAGTVASQISSNIVNTALGQYARRHYNFPGVTGEPNLDIPNELLLGHNFGVLDKIWETRIQGADSLSWISGKHFYRFGADINHVRNSVLWPGFTPIRIILPGINCLVDFANYVTPSAQIPSNFAAGPCPMALPPNGNLSLNPGNSPFPAVPGPNPADLAHGVPIAFQSAPLGTAVNFTPGIAETLPTNGWPYAYLPEQEQNFSVSLNHGYYGFFFQDQFKLTPKLTVNYGLRYDFESGLSQQMDVSHKGFQPRVGFAYSPDSKTVIRSGFGIFNDRYNLSFLFITYPQRPAILPGADLPPNRRDAEKAVYELNQYPYIPVPGIPTPADISKTFFSTGEVFSQSVTAPTSVGYSFTDRHSPIPYSEQASLEIDRQLGRGFTIGAGYLFVAAHHLLRSTLLNLCPVEGIASGLYRCDPAPTPPAGWPEGKNYYSGIPRYPAGLICCNDLTGNSVYHGGTLQVTKKSGKYLTLDANYTLSHTLDDGTFATFISVPEDVFRRGKERATSNQDARHRFVTNFTLTGPSNSFMRNFLLSNIVILQSPRPFTVFVGFDANNDLIPAADRVGNLSRNTYKGDSLKSWDVRLARTFQLDQQEKMKLELAVDAFNVLNRQNVDEVVVVYGTYNICGGQLPQQYKDAASLAIQSRQVSACPAAGPPEPNPSFGTPRTMFSPRQFQISAKLSF